MKKVLIGFSIFVGLIFLSFIIFIINFLLPINRFENKRIVIKKGQTFTEVYKDLKIDYTVVDKIYFKFSFTFAIKSKQNFWGRLQNRGLKTSFNSRLAA